MKMEDVQKIVLVFSFKLCIYIRTGISHYCMSYFDLNFTLSFSCTTEQYDELDTEINTVRVKENLLPLLCATASTGRLQHIKRNKSKRLM